MTSEAEQVEFASRGDAKAFYEIWTAHHVTVYRFAMWMLQDSAAAEDVTQECFLALLQQPRRFDPTRGSLRTFLLAIARNHCRIHQRASQLEASMETGDAELSAPDTVLDALASAETAAILNLAIARLPPLQREALFLFEYEELSLEDAAMVARTDVGTLKSRLYRGRQRLRRELNWLVKEDSHHGPRP